MTDEARRIIIGLIGCLDRRIEAERTANAILRYENDRLRHLLHVVAAFLTVAALVALVASVASGEPTTATVLRLTGIVAAVALWRAIGAPDDAEVGS